MVQATHQAEVELACDTTTLGWLAPGWSEGGVQVDRVWYACSQASE